MSIENPDSLAPLVEEFIQYLSARPDDMPIDKACEEWFPAHIFGKGPVFALAFQSYAICELASMYETAVRAGVTACASILYANDPGLGPETCAEMAKSVVQKANDHIIAEGMPPAGPAH